MFAPLLPARLSAAARIATTAMLALLLLVAGWTPTRVLPTLAAGAGAAGAALSAPEAALRLAPQVVEAGTPDRPLDAAAAAPSFRISLAGASPLASRAGAPRAVRPLARARARAPPTTV